MIKHITKQEWLDLHKKRKEANVQPTKAEKRNKIKVLHKFFSVQFTKAVEAYYNKFITDEDIDLYVNNEVSVQSRIMSVRKTLQDKKTVEVYKATVERNGNVIDTLIKTAEEDLLVSADRNIELYNITAKSAEESLEKQQKITENENRIAHDKKILYDLNTIREALYPTRKPGRPKKEDAVNLISDPQD